MNASEGKRPQVTEEEAYYERLRSIQEERWWKKVLPVQWPYRWKLKRQGLGRTLDVGCGIGRQLRSLEAGSIGVDHNEFAVDHVRRAGLRAMTVDEFRLNPGEQFDSVLFAHILEHMTRAEAHALVEEYLIHLRVGAVVLVICPQERGFASDPTHIWFATAESLVELLKELGLEVATVVSFPLPRRFGRAFIYNETWVRAIYRPRTT